MFSFRSDLTSNTSYTSVPLSHESSKRCNFLNFSLAFFEIAAWTAGVVSYAYLGLNRCVAICFYGTKAKTFNQVSVAIIASVSTWIVAIIAGNTLSCLQVVLTVITFYLLY